jgi:hypothetical protein
VDAAAKAVVRDRRKDKVKISVLSVLPAVPTPDNPRMAQAQRTTAHPARKAHGVTALSAAHATLPRQVCRVMISSINPLRTTKKTISNPAPMRIWAPKVV